MLFTSFAFAVFLAVTVALFFVLPPRWRALWLAVASYYFYMYGHGEFAWILLASTTTSYLGGLAMERWPAPAARRLALILCVVVNVGLLFAFKYSDFFIETSNRLLGTNIRLLHLTLPVGISFFTFQALSYCFDVYWRRFPVERRFDVFAAYKAFFPQLVAGPIERPANVVPQIKKTQYFDYERFVSGLRLIVWGLFKKLVVADRLAVLVTDAYGSPAGHTGVQLAVATYAFAFQIFCDFSAYTDIARGCARMMGIALMENFRQPYLARSIPAFWSRWHISLSTWFRDYLYIPLGGNRSTAPRWCFNVIIVFVVSGLWHGADWKFAIWGMLHAVFFLAGNWLGKKIGPIGEGSRALPLIHAAQCLLTFHLVVFAWIFFRADSLSGALLVIRKITHASLQSPILTKNFGPHDLLVAAMGILVIFAVELLQQKGGAIAFLERQAVWIRWPAYYALIFGIVCFAQQGQKSFIYFQF